ncbi:hypothetical protein P7C70_g8489, partial [Phenoliferia sp. Uapishka_3]
PLPGLTREQTDVSAQLWWKVLTADHEPARSEGFTSAGWCIVSQAKAFDSQTQVVSAHATFLHNTHGSALVGGNKPSAEWTQTMTYAKGIIAVLYERGLVPTQQPHRDLAALVIERNCQTTRGVAPGGSTGQNPETSPSEFAPLQYLKAGVNACAVRDLAAARALDLVNKAAKRAGAPMTQTRRRPPPREEKVAPEWARLQNLPVKVESPEVKCDSASFDQDTL